MTNHRNLILAIAFGIFSYGIGAHAAGTITGKITFKGTAPKEVPIKMNADPVCLKENAGKKVYMETVLVNANGTLGNTFVYLKEGVNKATVPPAPTTPFVFDQRGCVYHPKVFGIRVGQPMDILNSDPTLHNIHALPKKKENPAFNNGMATKGQKIEKKFGTVELGLKIKCDVHNWMHAEANVLDHPYFAVTDDQGTFTIKDVPAGDYTIEAFRDDKLGAKEAKVKVTDGGTATVDFAYGS
jgi:plastocyanin